MEAYASSPSKGSMSNTIDSSELLPSSTLTLQESEHLHLSITATNQELDLEARGHHPFPLAPISDNTLESMAWPTSESTEFPSAMDADWVWAAPVMNESYTSGHPDMSSAAALMDLFASSSGSALLDTQDQIGSSQIEAAGPAARDSHSGSDDHTEVTSQISERMGGLLASRDGRWRFYGATSNLHLARERQGSSCATQGSSHQPSQNAARLRLFCIDQPVEKSLEQHLIELYFTWHNPSLHIVDRNCFQRGRDQYMQDSKYSAFYSESLANAM